MSNEGDVFDSLDSGTSSSYRGRRRSPSSGTGGGGAEWKGGYGSGEIIDEGDEHLVGVDLKVLGEAVREDVKSEIREQLAKGGVEGIEQQEETTKKFALELVTTALADETLPKKFSDIIAGIVVTDDTANQAGTLVADCVIHTPWLYRGTHVVSMNALRYWVLRDENKVLRGQLVNLGRWLVPSKDVADLTSSTVVRLMDPDEGSLRRPFTGLIYRSIPLLNNVTVNAISNSLRHILQDQWYKDYVKEIVLEHLKNLSEKHKRKKQEDKQFKEGT